MNKELQEALGALLNKANNGMYTAGEFLVNELPDVIQQLLMWHGIYSFTLFIVGVVAMAISVPLFVKASKGRLTKGHWACPESSFDEMSFLGLCAFFLSVIFFIFGLVAFNLQWLKIWIAPKVWLLEYTASLVK